MLLLLSELGTVILVRLVGFLSLQQPCDQKAFRLWENVSPTQAVHRYITAHLWDSLPPLQDINQSRVLGRTHKLIRTGTSITHTLHTPTVRQTLQESEVQD